MRATDRNALALVSDVSDPESVAALANQVVNDLGRVDFVVNNAGAAHGSDHVRVTDISLDDWHRVINVNLNGAFYMSHFLGQKLVAQDDGGAIINISSIAGKLLPPNTAAYASSKAGLQALTASMAQEIGKYNIRVNAICPGVVDTYRTDDIPRGEVWDDLVNSRIPIGRAGSGEDIAWATVYLCSDRGSWITGQSYNVDGGTAVAHPISAAPDIHPASPVPRG